MLRFGAEVDIEELRTSRSSIDFLSSRVFKPLHILPGGIMLLELCDKRIVAHGKDEQAEAELDALVVEAASLHPPTDLLALDYFEPARFGCLLLLLFSSCCVCCICLVVWLFCRPDDAVLHGL